MSEPLSDLLIRPAEARDGTANLRHAIDVARRGYEAPRLEATLNARHFYERAGFREISRSTVRGNSVDIPVVVMEYDAG